MPLEYWIDDDWRVVYVDGSGVLTDEEFFTFQQTVWSRPAVAGYDELADMSDVKGVEIASSKRIGEFAALSASMDSKAVTRLAIVASDDMIFGLGKVYQARRHLEPRGTREVGVFRTREPALRWLGISAFPPNESKA